MFLPEGTRMAGKNLWSHKLRSLLTILGVVIGIASVLAVVTLGKSFETGITSAFDAVDDKTILVSVNRASNDAGQGPPDAGGLGRVFSDRDVEYIRALPGVEAVSVQGLQSIGGFRFNGTFYPYEQVSTYDPETDFVATLAGGYFEGRVFAEDAPEITLSHDVALTFGGGEPVPVGSQMQLIRLDGTNETVTVVGVLAAEQNAVVQFTANTIFAPIERYYAFPRQASPVTGEPVQVFDAMAVFAESTRGLEALADDIEDYLTSPESDADGFLVEDRVVYVATANDIVAEIGEAFDQITVFIGAIGGISLVVGAIGIANIMLVSVTERTREIGVMKAIGARDREILLMFLLEAVIIGLIGAVIGIALGVMAGYAVVNGVFASEGFAVVVPYDWIGISIVIGVGVGAVSGFIPALRATRIQPIQALAYE